MYTGQWPTQNTHSSSIPSRNSNKTAKRSGWLKQILWGQNEIPAATQTPQTLTGRADWVGHVVRNRVTHSDRQHGTADRRVLYKYLQAEGERKVIQPCLENCWVPNHRDTERDEVMSHDNNHSPKKRLILTWSTLSEVLSRGYVCVYLCVCVCVCVWGLRHMCTASAVQLDWQLQLREGDEEEEPPGFCEEGGESAALSATNMCLYTNNYGSTIVAIDVCVRALSFVCV